MGVTHAQNFESLTLLNLIKDYKVVIEDASLANKTCSPDTRSIKGKSARSNQALVVGSITKILCELGNVDEESKLSTSRLCFNSLDFATTIAHVFFMGKKL